MFWSPNGHSRYSRDSEVLNVLVMVLISCDLLGQKPLDYEAKEVDMQIFDVKSTCLNAMTTLNILYSNNRLPAHVGHFLIPSFIFLS
jgi:hypothetical protein